VDNSTSGSSPVGAIIGGIIGAGVIIGIGVFVIKKRKENNGGARQTPRDGDKKDK
jgi:LPXTG-motif cell wall-anchored protein